MTIFVDASALIAVVAGEDDADVLADRFEMDDRRLCSALSIWEAVAGLCRSYALAVPAAVMRVQSFVNTGGFATVPIGDTECRLAIDAYARFGKGRHPAALNMGDCFAYACAKSNGAILIYKGDDFRLTDLG